MNTSGKSEYQSQSHNRYRGRRLIAGAALLGTTAYGATELAKGAEHKIKSHINQGQEFATYSQYHLFQKMQESGGFDAGEVTTYEVTSDANENPTTIARKLHAKDITTVALEISAQEGGDHDLQPGDEVVLPLDQLKDAKPNQVPGGSTVVLSDQR